MPVAMSELETERVKPILAPAIRAFGFGARQRPDGRTVVSAGLNAKVGIAFHSSISAGCAIGCRAPIRNLLADVPLPSSRNLSATDTKSRIATQKSQRNRGRDTSPSRRIACRPWRCHREVRSPARRWCGASASTTWRNGQQPDRRSPSPAFPLMSPWNYGASAISSLTTTSPRPGVGFGTSTSSGSVFRSVNRRAFMGAPPRSWFDSGARTTLKHERRGRSFLAER